MDPTVLKNTMMRLNMYTLATSSLEPNRIEQETARLQELLKELEKNLQNLSSKMDKSNLTCLEIKKIQDNKSS